MKRIVVCLCLILLPILLIGQTTHYHAYKLKDKNNYIDADGNVRDRSGRILASPDDPYSNMDDYIEYDAKAFKEARKLQKKLSKQGQSGEFIIHTTPPGKENNNELNQPFRIPYGTRPVVEQPKNRPNQARTRSTNQDRTRSLEQSLEMSRLSLKASELANIALSSSNPTKKRLQAIRLLIKQKNQFSERELIKLATFDLSDVDVNNSAIREAATRGVTCFRTLEKISKNDSSMKVRKAAKRRLEALERQYKY